jgi:hypothetical protein
MMFSNFASWNYIAVGSDGGQLPGGGTYLTYISPDRQNFAIVLETMTLEVIHIRLYTTIERR